MREGTGGVAGGGPGDFNAAWTSSVILSSYNKHGNHISVQGVDFVHVSDFLFTPTYEQVLRTASALYPCSETVYAVSLYKSIDCTQSIS
jgi:hypothetical protein